MNYQPSPGRYAQIEYRRCGNSGLQLPAISFGLWHNFGLTESYEKCRSIIHTAFDCGITHFDLANNYGPPPGGAEQTFGKILKQDLQAHRDELILSSKAGWPMWPGPYGDLGSKKHLTASLHQSLKRMNVDYVDIFYHHRPDPNTPLEETMAALDLFVRQGKALYIGISSYSPEETKKAITILKSLGTPLLIHQPKYSLLHREPEAGLLQTLDEAGVGCITFSSLAQGVLTGKYLGGIPQDSRAARDLGNGAIQQSEISPQVLEQVKSLNEVATGRKQTLAQMSLAWVLKDPRITSVIIGASKAEQVLDSVQCLKNTTFTEAELSRIDEILAQPVE